MDLTQITLGDGIGKKSSKGVQSVPCRDTDKAKPHLKNSKPFQTNLSSSSHTIE